MAAGARTDPVDSRLSATGVVDVGDSTVISTCDVTEPRDEIRFRPVAAAACLGELTADDTALNGVVGE